MNEKELMKHIKHLVTCNNYWAQVRDKNDRLTIINDIFMNVWPKILNGHIPNDFEEAKNYIFISCRNTVLSHLRKKKIERDMFVNFEEVNVESSYEMDYKEENYKLTKILDFLELDIDREIYKLRLEGYTIAEISKILNMDYNRVRNINKSILDYLRKKIKDPNYKRKIIPKTRNSIYNVIDTTTDEVVFSSKHKRTIADKFKLGRQKINKFIDTDKIFNEKLTIKLQILETNPNQ